MPTEGVRNIVAAIDFSGVTDAVLTEARRQARAFGAKLWLVHVQPPGSEFVGFEVGPTSIRQSVAGELRQEHRRLQQYADSIRDEGLDVTAMLVPGPAAEKILAETQRLHADRVVLGSHGHGALYHLLVGSVCEAVLRKAPCPVTVVPVRPR